MFQNGISQNTKCAKRDGFRRAGHIFDHRSLELYGKYVWYVCMHEIVSENVLIVEHYLWDGYIVVLN